MKSTVFVRPNLKWFLFAALLIVLVNDLFVGLRIQASARTIPLVGKKGEVTDEEFTRLRQHVAQYPSPESYMCLSHCYQQRGEYKKAMECLVRADRLCEDREMVD